MVEKNTAKGVKTKVKNTKVRSTRSLKKRSACPPSMTKDTFVRMVSVRLHMDIGAYYYIIQ